MGLRFILLRTPIIYRLLLRKMSWYILVVLYGPGRFLFCMAHVSQRLLIRFYYSIIPCLALRGVAAGIARSCSLRAKILLCEWTFPKQFFFYYPEKIAVNYKNDRETDGYTAADYIQ
jgi:hypothetical protein